MLAPGVFTEIDRRTLESFPEPPLADVGRYGITRDPRDRWAYKTPSLRNVALTAPYMHDGSLPTLEAVMEFYDGGGIANPAKSPLLSRLGLTAEARAALVAFLQAFTGSGIERLVSQARRPPPGRPSRSAPDPSGELTPVGIRPRGVCPHPLPPCRAVQPTH